MPPCAVAIAAHDGDAIAVEVHKSEDGKLRLGGVEEVYELFGVQIWVTFALLICQKVGVSMFP